MALLAPGALASSGGQQPAAGPIDVLEIHELRIVDATGRVLLSAGSDAEGNGYLELANGAGGPSPSSGPPAGAARSTS